MNNRTTIVCVVMWAAVILSPLGALSADFQEILIRFHDHKGVHDVQDGVIFDRDQQQSLESLGVRLGRWYPSARVFRAHVLPGRSPEAVLKAVRRHPAVLYAEPNYRRERLSVVPNDPRYSEQWALEKIHMPEAWSLTTGDAGTLLAMVDTGIDRNHQDLSANVWKNPGEICGDFVDNDADGYVDNCYGINVIESSGDVRDDEGHGTFVSSVAAALGNNGVGMAGVTWRASIMAIKFLGASGGTVADFLEAVEFARSRGVRVMNLSFGSYSYSQAEKDAIASSTDMFFIAAAGNNRFNNDIYPMYPAGYELPNLVAVAASDESDLLATFSNYGIGSVHLAAPGTDILGAAPGNAYETGSGTSAATAVVSGAAAMVLSVHPTLKPPKLKERLLRTVDVPDTPLKVMTGGRLNVDRALRETIAGPYIYRVVPVTAPQGAVITLYGASFSSTPGVVRFSGNVAGEVVQWTDEKITVRVPKGAVSGPVSVETSEGVSPPVLFNVAGGPPGLKFRFAEVKAHADDKPVLILSNPLPEGTFVTVALIESTSGEVTWKYIFLSGFEKRFLWIEEMVPTQPPPSLMVEVSAESSVGSAVVSITDDFSHIEVMPHVVAR